MKHNPELKICILYQKKSIPAQINNMDDRKLFAGTVLYTGNPISWHTALISEL